MPPNLNIFKVKEFFLQKAAQDFSALILFLLTKLLFPLRTEDSLIHFPLWSPYTPVEETYIIALIFESLITFSYFERIGHLFFSGGAVITK